MPLFCFISNIFLAFFNGFIDRAAEVMTGNRERAGEWHAAKGPRPGVKGTQGRTRPGVKGTQARSQRDPGQESKGPRAGPGQESKGPRPGVKGTQARSQTRVRCRASAHGTHALPTELNGAPRQAIVLYCPLQCKLKRHSVKCILWRSPLLCQL